MGHAVARFGSTQTCGMYAASKFAVTALTETLRQELQAAKSKIKITVSNKFLWGKESQSISHLPKKSRNM